MYVDVSIPIRSYLKKFIAKSKEVEPFILSLSRCHFSAIILEPIKKGYVRASLKDSPLLNDQLTVRMNATVMKENKFLIDQETVMSIDQRLKAMFDQQMVDFIKMTNESRGDIKISAELFMDFYEITEDDLKLETVIKMYYRARYPVPSQKKPKPEPPQLQMGFG